MDSGNSGSLQSSSGGDEEYDSRAESFSAFLNPSQPQPPPVLPFHLHHTTASSSMFDPLSNYFDPMSRTQPPPPLQNPNSLLNLDMVWNKTLRSDPNPGEINPILTSSSSAQLQPFFSPFSSSPSTVPFPPVRENTTAPPRASSSSATPDQNHVGVVVRNPKKRSRASRRAPTTVLTTDTTNFRAMVQEFTGIPAPPFSSSPFPRSRFDLFGAPSSMRSNPLDTSQPPSYLLRPFAQKAQPPFLVDANNMQNPILTFQSLSPPKYPLPDPSILGPNQKTHGSLQIHSHDLDEFGLTHGQANNTNLSGLPNLVSSDGTAPRNDSRPMGSNGGDQGHLRSINGGYNVTNGKASENVGTRGEGMVESWICSSDL